MGQVFGERLKLALSVVDELGQGSALRASELDQSDDSVLIRQRRHAEGQRLQNGPANAELAAALCGLLELALKRRLIDLPRQKGRQQGGFRNHLKVKEVRAAHGRAWWLINTHRVEAGALCDKEHITSLEPVWLPTACYGCADRARPVHTQIDVHILHLQGKRVATGHLFDGAAKWMAGLDCNHRP